jgi:hypothetical protein
VGEITACHRPLLHPWRDGSRARLPIAQVLTLRMCAAMDMSMDMSLSMDIQAREGIVNNIRTQFPNMPQALFQAACGVSRKSACLLRIARLQLHMRWPWPAMATMPHVITQLGPTLAIDGSVPQRGGAAVTSAWGRLHAHQRGQQFVRDYHR